MRSKGQSIRANMQSQSERGEVEIAAPKGWRSRQTAKTVIDRSHNAGDPEALSGASLSSNERAESGAAASKSRKPVSIAEQLSKNYFLNSKQLLNHLSPARAGQEGALPKTEKPGQTDAPGQYDLGMFDLRSRSAARDGASS